MYLEQSNVDNNGLEPFLRPLRSISYVLFLYVNYQSHRMIWFVFQFANAY